MLDEEQKGFTLVELMITLAIISMLAFVAVPKFADMLEKSREAATKGNLAALQSALANYYADNQGVYPLTLDTATSTYGVIGYWPFVPYYIDGIPAVKATAKSTLNAVAVRGKGPGQGVSPALVTYGTFASPAFVATSDGKGWKYDKVGGSVWVNSGLFSMTGGTYTTFGFE